jgi:HD-GYP domain-containing protein (c-di-GMP phosphodiesterase class II)/DNA-binding CsgD family transcriptional regulator
MASDSTTSDPREGAGQARPAIRTADVLGALSLASDLAVGLSAEHGLRSCLIAMRLAERLSLSDWERITIYYTSLLMDAGCTAWTSQIAKRMLTDEIVARRELVFHTDMKDWRKVLAWMRRFIAPGAPVTKRAPRIIDFAAHGRDIVREGFRNTCDVARDLAARLGMSNDVQDALVSVFEQWDGSGLPQGLQGSAIPLPCRVVYVAAFFEVFHATGGRQSALDLTRLGRGRAFDPEAVEPLLSLAGEPDFWDALESDEGLWSQVMSLEPENRFRWTSEQQLTDATVALADFADLKSPYCLGHSRRVAALAEGMARRSGLSAADVVDVRQAALTHDLGLVAVPSFVLDKPQSRWTRAEWEQIRLHPYQGERILANVPSWRTAAAIVGAHHERVDGEGYPRGVKEREIPFGAQVIGVSDGFDELTHDSPDRPALAAEDALRLMEREVARSFSAPVLDLLRQELGFRQGATPAPRREWPMGLTDREVEVLRLAARGLSRREMAQKLYVSESTVRTHLEHIYTKIGVSSRASATLFAVEHDLLN